MDINEFPELISFEEIQDYKIVNNKCQEVKKAHVRKKHKTKLKTEIGVLNQISGENSEIKNKNIIKNWSSYNLPDVLTKAIIEVGYEKPTEIQEKTLKLALFNHNDIVGAAETGSGKTLAFGLPILHGILKQKEHQKTDANNLFAIILTPTRELAVQIKNNLKSIAKYTGIKIAAVFGGLALVKQERILSKCPEVVIATPGRLWELLNAQNEHLSKIRNVKFLVIDETDRMLEKDHFLELHQILEIVNEDTSQQRQNFVFSATLTMVHDLPEYLKIKKKVFGKKIAKMTSDKKLKKIIELLQMKSPKVVDVTLNQKGMAKSLTEAKINCFTNEKDLYVYYFLTQFTGRTLIFCNSIGCVKRLYTLLSLLNCYSLPLHASLQQKQRLKNLEKFRDNDRAILIATDVAARGLDIPNIEHVIHYQTPRTSESYVHRSGRTARLSKRGLTLLLVDPSEAKQFNNLYKNLEKTDELPNFPVDKSILNVIKERVQIAQELDKVELKMRKLNLEKNWIQKASDDMDIIVDDELLSKSSVESFELKSVKKSILILRKQLECALSKPIIPSQFSINYPTAFGQNFFEWQSVTGNESGKRAAVDLVNESIKPKRIKK